MDTQDINQSNNRVLVIGGGIGGIKAATDLAEGGKDVLLIDKAPSIGGLMTQLDRTFPTNNCDLCTLSPQLAESARQLHIELSALTQLISVEGEVGSFTGKFEVATTEPTVFVAQSHLQQIAQVVFVEGFELEYLRA